MDFHETGVREKSRRQGAYMYILRTCVYVCMSVYDSLSLEKGREGHRTGCWHESSVGELRGEASEKESLC